MPGETHTLHILLATMPLAQSEQYIDSIRHSYYHKFRDTTCDLFKDPPSENPGAYTNLYEPAIYYMLGNYDIAFVSIIDSLKFAQNLFIPDGWEATENTRFVHTNAFQTITGICQDHSHGKDQGDLLAAFSARLLPKDSPGRIFFSTINIKINNGLLIGNGTFLFREMINLLTDCFRDLDPDGNQIDYFILQSFSWYEINLTMCYDDIKIMQRVMSRLRSFTLKDLAAQEARNRWENSLYGLSETWKEDRQRYPHLFIDTQTYTGFRYDYFETMTLPNIREKLQAIKFTTEIEWQLLPGYLNNLSDFLDTLETDDPITGKREKIFNTSGRFMLTGKSDYFFEELQHTLYKKLLLFKQMITPESPVREYVKKVKSRILLPNASEDRVPDHQDEFSYFSLIRAMSISHEKIETVMKQLKSLKISRQLSNKIKKILFSYNGGIEDQVLYPYYLDFHIFIQQLIDEINSHAARFQHLLSDPAAAWKNFAETQLSDDPKNRFKEFRVQSLEGKLLNYIEVFEKAHQVRMLTSYQFEDITDLDLDFNMSIQQLLSIYNTMVVVLGNLIYPNNQYGPLVQLNLSSTQMNTINIYYNIYHLLSPEFIFSNLSMDILSYYQVIMRAEKKDLVLHIDKCKDALTDLMSRNAYLKDYVKSNLVDFKRFLLDSLRFIFTYNLNFDLYRFWFWTYNLQNSSLYSKMGLFDEDHFKTELLRLLFLVKMFNLDTKIDEHSCPIPELQTYWSRYYKNIKDGLDAIFTPAARGAGKSNAIDMFGELLAPILRDPLTAQMTPVDIDRKWNNALNGGKMPEEPGWKDTLANFLVSRAYPSEGTAGQLRSLLPTRNSCFACFSSHMKQKLQDGIPILYDENFENPALFLSALMYTYLGLIYERNGGGVHLLKRDWETGEPIKSFINAETDNYLYSVDQLGGIFFDAPEKLNRYFRMRNGLLQTLWHFAYTAKRQYIAKVNSKKETEP